MCVCVGSVSKVSQHFDMLILRGLEIMRHLGENDQSKKLEKQGSETQEEVWDGHGTGVTKNGG